MEVAALAGLLAVGYALTRKPTGPAAPEQFADGGNGLPELANGGLPPPLFPEDRTRAGEPTVPGLPRQPRATPSGELDYQFQLPSGGSASTPLSALTQPDLYQRDLVFAAPAAPQAPPTAVSAQVRFNTDGVEAPPVYNSGRTVISSLTGLPMPAQEFTHNNMQPFYRGSVKQNMSDFQNRDLLDNMIGTGVNDIGKREQAPLFEPHREPTGNITGMESATSFIQDRMVAPTNRAGERPVEPTMVGPGLGQGYTPFPTGGFQQMEVNEIMMQRKSVDETRYASDPRVSYEGQVIVGKALNGVRGEMGEVRKYRPDTFFLNQNGERNFTTAGENTRPTERPAQVMKFQAREETTSELMGPAVAADFSATYTVPSFRAPFARQHDGYGYRNADGSTYGVSNTDAENNDFGRAGYALPTNQRNVTGERGQGLNLTVAGGPKAMTVYDPSDIARTTVRETTGANDWVGIAGAVEAKKLTVYDPADIARPTGRNTMAEPDHALNVTRAGTGAMNTLPLQDGARMTTKAQVSAASAYGGSAGPAMGGREQVYDYAYEMRQNPTKEQIASGRRPIAGNGSLPLFNGEDYMNVSYRRLDSDSFNDRANTVDRVVGPPPGSEMIGLQRPKQVLQLDVAADRNIHEILDSLSDNPYALPVHKIAAGLPANNRAPGPAEIAAGTIYGRW
jgi:hypothetical protein